MRRQPIDVKYPYCYGIDISHWNGEVNFKKVCKHTMVRYVISRTGDGKDTDKTFLYNYSESGKAGLIKGSYHYFRADRGGKYQAEKVVGLLDTAGFDDKDLPPALDIEEGARQALPDGFLSKGNDEKDLSRAAVLDEAISFCETIEKFLGVTPLIYTGQAMHWWYSQDPKFDLEAFKDCPLWLSSYSHHPKMPVDTDGNFYPWDMPTFWQFTSEGSISGVSGDVDLNRFLGTKKDLEDFIKSTRTSNAGQNDDELKLHHKSFKAITELHNLKGQIKGCKNTIERLEKCMEYISNELE